MKTFNHAVAFILLLLFFGACTNQQDLASVEGLPETNTPPDEVSAYSVINNFVNESSPKGVVALLKTATGKQYIVPPTRYVGIRTEKAIIEGFKPQSVDSCTNLSEKDFPVFVYLCEPDPEESPVDQITRLNQELEEIVAENEPAPALCSRVRDIAPNRIAQIFVPGHYGLSGVGGLLVLEVYPVSPCSPSFEEYIQNAGEYQPVESI